MKDVHTARSVSRRGFLRTAAGTAAVAGAAGAAGTASAQEGGVDEIIVGPEDDQYTFEPGTDETAYVTPGTTVTFVWETDSHNVVVDAKPDESDFEGHQDIESAGFEFEHTFEVEGEYEIVCQPHAGQGMVATIEVTEDPPEQGGGDDGGAAAPTVPDSAKTLAIATIGAMLSTLGLGYVFMKYGGDYGSEEY